jgi:hypothetical protein
MTMITAQSLGMRRKANKGFFHEKTDRGFA